MKAHICGAPSRDASETRAQRIQRLKIAKAIKEARKKDAKKEPESIETKNASLLESVETDSRDFHSMW